MQVEGFETTITGTNTRLWLSLLDFILNLILKTFCTDTTETFTTSNFSLITKFRRSSKFNCSKNSPPIINGMMPRHHESPSSPRVKGARSRSSSRDGSKSKTSKGKDIMEDKSLSGEETDTTFTSNVAQHRKSNVSDNAVGADDSHFKASSPTDPNIPSYGFPQTEPSSLSPTDTRQNSTQLYTVVHEMNHTSSFISPRSGSGYKMKPKSSSAANSGNNDSTANTSGENSNAMPTDILGMYGEQSKPSGQKGKGRATDGEMLEESGPSSSEKTTEDKDQTPAGFSNSRESLVGPGLPSTFGSYARGAGRGAKELSHEAKGFIKNRAEASTVSRAAISPNSKPVQRSVVNGNDDSNATEDLDADFVDPTTANGDDEDPNATEDLDTSDVDPTAMSGKDDPDTTQDPESNIPEDPKNVDTNPTDGNANKGSNAPDNPTNSDADPTAFDGNGDADATENATGNETADSGEGGQEDRQPDTDGNTDPGNADANGQDADLSADPQDNANEVDLGPEGENTGGVETGDNPAEGSGDAGPNQPTQSGDDAATGPEDDGVAKNADPAPENEDGGDGGDAGNINAGQEDTPMDETPSTDPSDLPQNDNAQEYTPPDDPSSDPPQDSTGQGDAPADNPTSTDPSDPPRDDSAGQEDAPTDDPPTDPPQDDNAGQGDAPADDPSADSPQDENPGQGDASGDNPPSDSPPGDDAGQGDADTPVAGNDPDEGN